MISFTSLKNLFTEHVEMIESSYIYGSSKPGEEQHEIVKRKMRRGYIELCRYEYRALDGRFFSCVADSLVKCREYRDAWQKEAMTTEQNIQPEQGM